MATYSRPGVFVEETLQALTSPGNASGPATAAFVGVSSKGGPVGPTLVSSWSQFQTLFGGLRGNDDDLPFAVYSFFNNGGSQCYVTRVTSPDATAASLAFNGVDPDGAGTGVAPLAFTATAKAAGSWGSNISITIATSANTNHFDVTVNVTANGTIIASEPFIDLSLDPSEPRNAISVINSPVVGSKYVTLTAGDAFVSATASNPVPVTAPLTGGTDGTALSWTVTSGSSTGSTAYGVAMHLLDVIDDQLVVNLPGVTDSITINNAISWAANGGGTDQNAGAQSRFIVIDAPKPTSSDSTVVSGAMLTAAGQYTQSSFGAVYGPWLYFQDPSAGVPGALRLAAPGGAVLGQIARMDVTRGVGKAPAGTLTSLKVIGASVRFTDAQLDSLNAASVNVIRSLPGYGTCIMGARTLNVNYPDRYVNIRRTLLDIEHNLMALTRYAVFEPNDQVLWDSLSLTCQSYLRGVWQAGNLSGSNASQAFYVKCDSDTNTPAAVNAGQVVIEVGVALASPAEFIVIRIGQFDGGSNVSETGA